VPFLPVADVERSIACYGLLGFEQGDSYAPVGRPVWASLRCQAARLMVAEAEAPINPTNRRSSSTCTRTTWPAFAATLSPTASRRASSLTAHRDRATRCASTDPDGYCLMVAQIDDETIIGR
jgi:hypothetical protein